MDIADIVSSHKENIQDPELTAILEEIDLRAQVEIAKMRISLDSIA
ncbi:MAG: flagellar assembly protein FliX [Bdellovibrionales bacterium]